MVDEHLVNGACPHDCPDTCGWQVTVSNGVATTLLGNKNHPFTQGGLCAKVNRFLEDRVYHPDRLLYPLKRTGKKGEGKFERVGWDEALEAVAAKLLQLIQADEAESILPYSYMGTMGLVQSGSIDKRLFAKIGASRLDRTICGMTAMAGLQDMMGTPAGFLPEDIVHSRFIIIWGTNPIVSNLHLWPFILEARKQGAKLVVIDPIKTRTAAQADWHIQIRPGTDELLALAMMHVLVDEGLCDEDYIAQHTHGFSQLAEHVRSFSPASVAETTGLAAEDIIRLAREYAAGKPSAIRVLIGMSFHQQGARNYSTIACLPALVGAWKDLGGGLLGVTGHFMEAIWESRFNQLNQEREDVRLINMVKLGEVLTDTSLSPAIKSLIVYNSNPFITTPNQNLIREGLERKDLFTVVIEQFMTDTARYADYIFPATTQVEHTDLMWSWGHTYLALNKPAIKPLGEAKSNTDFFRLLAKKMIFDDACLQDSDEEMIRQALDVDHPLLEGVTFDRLSREAWVALNLPQGYRPFERGNYPTESGRCELYINSMQDQDLIRVINGKSDEKDQHYPLNLLTPKSTHFFLNSSYANCEHRLKKLKQQVLLMHSRDAAERGIKDDDKVKVHNQYGVVEASVKVGEEVPVGTAALSAGWWASLAENGTANSLTGDGLSDKGGGSAMYDARVEVERMTAKSTRE